MERRTMVGMMLASEAGGGQWSLPSLQRALAASPVEAALAGAICARRARLSETSFHEF